MKEASENKPTNSKRQRRRSRIILVAFGVTCSLLMSELLLRCTPRFKPPPHPIVCRWPTLFQQWDPYGYRLWPSRTLSHHWPSNSPSIQVVTNQHGFRSRRDFYEPDQRKRVLVLGDSQVFGLGVQQEDRFTNKMESMNPKWRVDNMGMTAYGTDLMLMALEEVGLDTHPDVVLVCIFTDDFYRVRSRYAGVGFEIPRFQLEGGQLKLVPYPERRIWDSLHLVQLLRKAKWNWTSAEWDLNEAILRQFIQKANQHDFRLGFVFLPGPMNLENDQRRRAWLKDFVNRNHHMLLDLTPAIHEAGDQAFIPHDVHFNALGNQIIAEQLELFTKKLLEDCHSPSGNPH